MERGGERCIYRTLEGRSDIVWHSSQRRASLHNVDGISLKRELREVKKVVVLMSSRTWEAVEDFSLVEKLLNMKRNINKIGIS